MQLDDFKRADLLGLDIETYDPNLIEKGTGVYRQDGYIAGVSFATDRRGIYLPLRHPDTTPEEAEHNLKIIRELCSLPNAKVGANIFYDLDWLVNGYGIKVNGRLHDIQYAEPLLDEYRQSYSLGKLAPYYGCQEKAAGLLEEFAASRGMKFKRDVRELIYKMPSTAVARYAEVDGILPVQILRKQLKRLEAQELTTVYELETDLIPLLLQMRKQGVRLDMDLFYRTEAAIAQMLTKLERQLYQWAGTKFDIGSTAQLAKVFDKKGIEYPRKEPTALMQAKGKQGNPNLDKMVLNKMAANGVSVAQKVLAYRHYKTLTGLFIEPYKGFLVDGRIHCQFNPLRSDDYGAVSGRFSSSKPNLQQVSAQDDSAFAGDDAPEVLKGQILRKMFIPEEGCSWGKYDYSQVEYRIGAHYALGPGSDELREAYITNPMTDYHKHIQDLTGFDRRTAKRLNFGATYGMGAMTAAKQFGWTQEEAERFMEGYHAAAPYLKITRARVTAKAQRAGYVYTLLKRRARVSPTRKLHSLYNRLIQGTAADIMKKALRDAYQAGIFNTLPPHITVHDEIDVSIAHTPEAEEAKKELHHILENCVQLRVPLVCECHTASNWAEAD